MNGIATVGKGCVLLGGNLVVLMLQVGIAREALVVHGLKFIRRKLPDEVVF